MTSNRWHCEAVAVGMEREGGVCSPSNPIHNPPCGPIPDDVVLPCGCLIAHVVADHVRTLRLSPCGRGCTVVADTLAEAANQGKPVEWVEL